MAFNLYIFGEKKIKFRKTAKLFDSSAITQKRLIQLLKKELITNLSE